MSLVRMKGQKSLFQVLRKTDDIIFMEYRKSTKYYNFPRFMKNTFLWTKDKTLISSVNQNERTEISVLILAQN